MTSTVSASSLRDRAASNTERATSTSAHARANVLGVQVSAIDMAGALAVADHCLSSGERGYICLTGVHGVMEAFKDSHFRLILNRSLLNAPDGMPMTWVGRMQGHLRMDRVFGPDLMLELCRLSAKRGYRQFLYGGQAGVADLLAEALTARIPGLQIVGTHTPPFRNLDEHEQDQLIGEIRRTRPDILWVGLSTPRQERFMVQYYDRLQVPLMVGVGAAFDYHTGRIRDCAPWIKRAGLQWLHRLIQDPKRLARRYFRTHPAFVWHISMQLLGVRGYADQHAGQTPDLTLCSPAEPGARS